MYASLKALPTLKVLNECTDCLGGKRILHGLDINVIDLRVQTMSFAL